MIISLSCHIITGALTSLILLAGGKSSRVTSSDLNKVCGLVSDYWGCVLCTVCIMPLLPFPSHQKFNKTSCSCENTTLWIILEKEDFCNEAHYFFNP